MEVKREEKTPPSEIKNKLVYYSSMVANLVTFGTSIISAFFLNVYYDTITNKNNNNWDAETRKNNLSGMSLCYNLGGLTGMILGFFISKANPRVVLNLSRLVISICFLCLAVPNLQVMLVSRYFSNLFSLLAQVTIIWNVYELYLVKHQANIMISFSLIVSLTNLLVSLSSKFDPGDAWYWKKILCILPSLLILSLLADLFCSKQLNSVTYQIRQHGAQKATESLREVFSDDHTEALIQRFEKQLQLEERDRLRLAQKGVSQWAVDLTVYKSSFITLLIVSFLISIWLPAAVLEQRTVNRVEVSG